MAEEIKRVRGRKYEKVVLRPGLPAFNKVSKPNYRPDNFTLGRMHERQIARTMVTLADKIKITKRVDGPGYHLEIN